MRECFKDCVKFARLFAMLDIMISYSEFNFRFNAILEIAKPRSLIRSKMR